MDMETGKPLENNVDVSNYSCRCKKFRSFWVRSCTIVAYNLKRDCPTFMAYLSGNTLLKNGKSSLKTNVKFSCN